MAINNNAVAPSKPAFYYLVQTRDPGRDSIVWLLDIWGDCPSNFHYCSSNDQSLTGPTCRKATFFFARRTCKYFDAVDLFTLRSFAISLIELFGLSPSELIILSSIASSSAPFVEPLMFNNDFRVKSALVLIICLMLPLNRLQSHPEAAKSKLRSEGVEWIESQS